MPDIAFFLEDDAHEAFLVALTRRIAHENGLQVRLIPRSVRGGYGTVISELKDFLSDLETLQGDRLPDCLIVATDANCKGYSRRRKEVLDAAGSKFEPFIVCAIPDPHIERWFLLDSAAFKKVLGKGCSPPDQKCERDRYKNALTKAVQEAGVAPLLGGTEFAPDIVAEMDLSRAARHDPSLARFLDDFHAWIKRVSNR